MALTPGTRLGPYEILSPLGAGGMGEVYRARDTRLARDVAVKVLPEHLSASSEDRARFQREAKAISALNHPHICTLHDVGREGSTDYLVMELVEGETLAQRLLRGALPASDVLKLGAQIADALQRAHRAGVVHRDLKPGNVMLTRSGAKLMDFGLARTGGHSLGGAGGATATVLGRVPRSEEPITAKGMVVGTVQYMAPEQLEGRGADARSDLWALGCVLYEMATGSRAFDGSTPASVISSIMRDEPRTMSEMAPLTPPALERVVRQCLEKDPDERWQNAGDLRRELLWIAEAGSRAGLPASISQQRRVEARAAWSMATIAVIAAVALGILWWRASESRARHLTFTPLTFKPMIIYKAAFAPDGKTVVLSAGMGGINPRIYVIRPEYPEPQPISEPGTHLLSVSTTGELAVLTHVRMPRGVGAFLGTLARMPLGGGAPREVLEDVREADWSPDGAQLAVLRVVDGKDRLEYPVGHLVPGAGQFLSDIRVSPSGEMIAYFEHPDRHESGGSVDVIDRRGRRRVLSRGYSAEGGIAWSPDGKEIYVSAIDSTSETPEVFRLSMWGARRYAISSAGGVVVEDVRRDGRWLVTRDESRTALMVHKPEWREDHDLSWLDRSRDGHLSGDGSLLAFTEHSSALGDQPVMCLRKTDGSPVVKLGVGRVTSLSRDGKRVLALIFSHPPHLAIYPTGPGEPVRVGQGSIENVMVGEFSPGGDSVAIFGNLPGKAEQWFLQDFSGAPPKAVTPEGTLFVIGSPDWRHVAVNGFDRSWTLYSLNGEKPRPFPALTARDEPLRWNPDGRSILVLDPQDPLGPIQSVDITTGHRTPFIEALPGNREGLVRRILTSITDDNRCYAYTADWGTSALFLVKAGK